MKDFERFGVMIDCSRNGVMRVEQMKKFMVYLQKMGYNCIGIYMEDTFEINGEPYFGYQRGRYTQEELKEIDRYAVSLGMEVFPCIQTLAHFTALVRRPQYSDIVDVNDILLIDEPKTYALIEKIFATMAECFSSRIINIGMDEAHLVGLGRYLDKHGFCNREELLVKHLNKVVEIAEKYGFKPNMWSDMFFRLENKGEYYVKDAHISKATRNTVPESIELVYWDYYNLEKATYDGMLLAHKEFDRKVWFAGGVWTWHGFAPFNTYSLRRMKPAMQSVREHDIKNVIITMWGDDGKECSYFSVLPALYAIRKYAGGEFDIDRIKETFNTDMGMSFDDLSALETINWYIDNPSGETVENPCKALLYNDCFNGQYDVELAKWQEIPFGDYAKRFNALKSNVGEFAYLFEMMERLCICLDTKAYLGVRTRKAYQSGDKNEMSRLVADYEQTLKSLQDFRDAFYDLWHRENKAFGWEVQEIRLGGLAARIKACAQQVKDYINGHLEMIEELEEPILVFAEGRKLSMDCYRNEITMNNL